MNVFWIGVLLLFPGAAGDDTTTAMDNTTMMMTTAFDDVDSSNATGDFFVVDFDNETGEESVTTAAAAADAMTSTGEVDVMTMNTTEMTTTQQVESTTYCQSVTCNWYEWCDEDLFGLCRPCDELCEPIFRTKTRRGQRGMVHDHRDISLTD